MARQEPGTVGPERPALLVVAAPKEAEAIVRGLGVGGVDCRRRRWEAVELRPGFELVISGVGKACAAGAVATVFDPGRHGAVLNLGVAGSLPVENAPALGDAVLADLSVYADEGVESPDGFDDVASMGFSPAPPGFEAMGLAVPGDTGLIESLRHLADRVGPVATVSTCAGTDALAATIARRTRAVAEAMEGAAVGFTALCVCAARGAPVAPFLEVRVISNTTGDRQSQRWDLPGSLERLGAVSHGVVEALGA